VIIFRPNGPTARQEVLARRWAELVRLVFPLPRALP